MNYNIRLSTEEDCDELSKLKHDIWETTYRGIYPDDKIDNFDYDKNKNSFINIINNPDIELYVVEDKEKIIGLIMIIIGVYLSECDFGKKKNKENRE